GAGDVDVCALAGIVGESGAHHVDGVAPFACIGARLGVLHASYIVGIGNTHVADATENVAGYVAVAARGLAAKVGLQAPEPFFGRFDPVVGDKGGDQA